MSSANFRDGESYRCSLCGWVRKGNRKLKRFKCDKCGYTADSDLNASINLSLNLTPISDKKRLLRSNRTGFYWNEVGQEPIVSDALKA
jgi:transposase